MKNNFLPPEEPSAEKTKQQFKALRAEVARREAVSGTTGEYWIDIAGNILHISEMHSEHLAKCLDMLWRSVIKEAKYITHEEYEDALALAFGALASTRGEIASDYAEMYADNVSEAGSAENAWSSEPFVRNALLALAARDYVYIKPWEREPPF